MMGAGAAAATAKVARGGRYEALGRRRPEVQEAYERLADACRGAGPLDARDVALVKVALSMGLGSTRSVHAHARKALEAGIPPEALRHLVLVGLPTLGLPATLDAAKWIDETIAERSRPAGRRRR
jgi:alkylhydroperoxidase/carboxymuconolactone decarboxylase family protein YurZ